MVKRTVFIAINFVLLLLSFTVIVEVAHAATITVNTLTDEDAANASCSLREAITAANNNSAYRGCNAGSGTDTINFSVTGTINLSSQLPVIQSAMNFVGPGAANLTIRRNTGGNYRLLWVFQAVPVNISGITFANGRVSGAVCGGAGIYNHPNAVMTISDSIFFHNLADCSGGGLFNEGTVTITNTVFRDNDGGFEGEGGALFNNYGGTMTVVNSAFIGNLGRINGGAIHNHATLTVRNSSFTGNYAGDDCPTCNPPLTAAGGTISNFPGTLVIENSTISTNSGGGIVSAGTATLANSTVVFNSPKLFGGIANNAGNTFNIRNSIIGGNGAGTGGTDLYGVFTSQGYNIVGTTGTPGSSTINGNTNGNQVNVSMASVNLGAFQNNGGATSTHALLPGSIAINAGNPSFVAPPSTDQRGSPRVMNLRLDIGAYESDLPPANTDLIFDGAFNQGLANWAPFGDVFARVFNGVFEISHNSPSTQDTGFYQFNPYSAPAGGTFELTFDIGNRGQQFRTLNIVIGNANWTDIRNCFLTVPANRALATYTMRFRALQAWPNIVFRGYVLQAVNDPAVLLDNLSLQYKPSLSFSGNQVCPTIL